MHEKDNEIFSIKFLPDNIHIVSGGKDMTLRIYDIKTGKLIHYFKEYTNYIK